MNAPVTRQSDSASLPDYRSILLAVDSSDHANRGIEEAVALAGHFSSSLTAVHVYAAKLHDVRFRQMEGGLPEQFREEQELERQRDVHDDLISRGLSIITDSYLDQVQRRAGGITVKRRSLEGKNYRELVNEANSGNYDLLVMGALGLGAVKSSRIGSVASRVARRASIDTLIIKEPTRPLSTGPIVVAVDGSAKSYGGLLSAFSLARIWDCEVKVISAFDPYYHYVAFNRIAGVLSEEAGKVFRFQEQEKLHEEIIDSGLAKIYQGHLSIARSIAADHGVEVECVLLDGKPHDVINRYLQQVEPSLLVMGTTGIHADDGLDIGGNAEQLLIDARCAVLLSQRQHRPEVDRLASVTTSWTREAEARMERVPSFVRAMAKMAILRYAQEKGHTVITESIVEEATAQLMPNHAEQAMEEILSAHDRGELKPKPDAPAAARWSEEATRLLLTVKDLSLRGNLSMRAEKRARTEGANQVEEAHLLPFLGGESPQAKQDTPSPSANLDWQAAALARLMRVPEGFMRDSSRQRIETYARNQGATEITLAIAEAGLAKARAVMEERMRGEQAGDRPADSQRSGCPFAPHENGAENPKWAAEAEAMLERVPEGFCRDMTRKATQSIAKQRGQSRIGPDFVAQIMQTFQSGSAQAVESLSWDEDARERIARAPDMVRGMLIKEIESWAQNKGLARVSREAVEAAKQIWSERGRFHLDPSDPRTT